MVIQKVNNEEVKVDEATKEVKEKHKKKDKHSEEIELLKNIIPENLEIINE